MFKQGCCKTQQPCFFYIMHSNKKQTVKVMKLFITKRGRCKNTSSFLVVLFFILVGGGAGVDQHQGDVVTAAACAGFAEPAVQMGGDGAGAMLLNDFEIIKAGGLVDFVGGVAVGKAVGGEHKERGEGGFAVPTAGLGDGLFPSVDLAKGVGFHTVDFFGFKEGRKAVFVYVGDVAVSNLEGKKEGGGEHHTHKGGAIEGIDMLYGFFFFQSLGPFSATVLVEGKDSCFPFLVDGAGKVGIGFSVEIGQELFPVLGVGAAKGLHDLAEYIDGDGGAVFAVGAGGTAVAVGYR